MLLAVLVVFAAPSLAAQPLNETVIAQQQQQPQQTTPKRDCERKQDKGVS